MSMTFKINLIILVLLGLMTGLVKVFGLEADVEIFANMGFSYQATVIFGIIQVLAALLLIWPKSRRLGAIIIGLSFIIATYGLFVTELIAFGIFSILFIAMAALAFYSTYQFSY